jgi:hypothetical protein
MVFSTDLTHPPLIVFPTVADPAPVGHYVFASTGGFSFALDTPDNSNNVSLTISDSTSPPVQTNPGANDTLARITVMPGANLTGPIVLSFSADFVYSSEAPRLDPPDPITINQASDTTSPVPAPPGVVLFAVGGLVLAARARLARRAA